MSRIVDPTEIPEEVPSLAEAAPIGIPLDWHRVPNTREVFCPFCNARFSGTVDAENPDRTHIPRRSAPCGESVRQVPWIWRSKQTNRVTVPWIVPSAPHRNVRVGRCARWRLPECGRMAVRRERRLLRASSRTASVARFPMTSSSRSTTRLPSFPASSLDASKRERAKARALRSRERPDRSASRTLGAGVLDRRRVDLPGLAGAASNLQPINRTGRPARIPA
jgi:hypothetical protein